MTTSFYGGAFFSGEFFNNAAVVDQPSNWQQTPRDFLWSRKEIEVEEVVDQIAKRQVEDLHLDEQQRFEELARELELKGLEYETRYLEMLNSRREALINVEIGKLIRKRIDEQDLMILLLMAASV